jgi:hypothetical protein
MTGQNKYNAVAPHSSVVLTISEILSPVVLMMVNSLFRLSQMLRRNPAVSGKLANAASASDIAPHVALVMVPGNYVTAPFRRD